MCSYAPCIIVQEIAVFQFISDHQYVCIRKLYILLYYSLLLPHQKQCCSEKQNQIKIGEKKIVVQVVSLITERAINKTNVVNIMIQGATSEDLPPRIN